MSCNVGVLKTVQCRQQSLVAEWLGPSLQLQLGLGLGLGPGNEIFHYFLFFFFFLSVLKCDKQLTRHIVCCVYIHDE